MSRDSRFLVAVLVLAGYLAAARGVGSFYPISTFAMYASAPGQSASRIMARSSSGEYLEVTDFDGWRCDRLPALDRVACADARSVPYVDREREEHIRSHAGAGGQEVELVRRVFSFDGVARPPYCTIAHCSARRRP